MNAVQNYECNTVVTTACAYVFTARTQKICWENSFASRRSWQLSHSNNIVDESTACAEALISYLASRGACAPREPFLVIELILRPFANENVY